ncbi:MAG: anhydro-N-acetylmuramic acid kinase [Bacteroidetes bacterium]|nr:anhydro-N-acetylmuramic acid kinase [Bacteroidota bacterium]
MKEYTVIGLMSGTSLDGLDIACCRFFYKDSHWKYSIMVAETIPYSGEWFNRLSDLPGSAAADYAEADHAFGHLSGKLAREFIERHDIKADFIASHGHTVFHQPSRGFTSQIGNGAAIKAETGLPVVCDFRSGDVAQGGQGAPLVPAGDRLLFSDFDFCLNLGGFANISFEHEGERIAFDICPVNIVLNRIAGRSGQSCDQEGAMASRGKVNIPLLDTLNNLSFYNQKGPKSLGKEWVELNIFPLLNNSELSDEDILSTFCTHIADKIALQAGTDSGKKILATGGGVYNKYLVSQISQRVKPTLVIPSSLTIDFKEALIFAFLGVLRWRSEINCLKTVTGAKQDGSFGAIY